MRTSLVYSVLKDDVWDSKKGCYVKKITSRGFDFYVSGAKSESEHVKVVENFYDYLTSCGFSADFFGNGTWEENLRYNDTKSFEFLSIPVDDTWSKEEIESLYKTWKKQYKG